MIINLYYRILIFIYYIMPSKRLYSFYLYLKHIEKVDVTMEELISNLSKYKTLVRYFNIKTENEIQ